MSLTESSEREFAGTTNNIMKICHRHTFLIFNLTFPSFLVPRSIATNSKQQQQPSAVPLHQPTNNL